MNFTKLRRNIFDVIKEEQVKLGYRKEAIRLYYPIQSLNRLLDTQLGEVDMKSALKAFAKSVEDELGIIKISSDNNRFCFFLPEQATEFIYKNTEQDGFIHDFIATVAKHHVSIDELIELFGKYSDHVHFEKVNHGEFDYIIYFEDGKPDDYRYCLTDEGEHFIYHRYTKEDYEDLGL